jgi:hypothetical protein
MVDAGARRPGRGRILLVLLLLLVGLAGAALAARNGARLYWRLAGPPIAARQADAAGVAGWMTVPYVARGYGVPGQTIFAALGVEPEENRQRSLDAIADRHGRDRGEVVAVVRAAIATHRSTSPPPASGPGRPPPGAAP